MIHIYSKSSFPQHVRINALELIEDITKYPEYTVLPLKTDVILGLTGSLDDKKRYVRNAAVKTRNTWFLIGAPT